MSKRVANEETQADIFRTEKRGKMSSRRENIRDRKENLLLDIGGSRKLGFEEEYKKQEAAFAAAATGELAYVIHTRFSECKIYHSHTSIGRLFHGPFVDQDVSCCCTF